MIKTCKHCGKKFETKRYDQKYHTYGCFVKDMMARGFYKIDCTERHTVGSKLSAEKSNRSKGDCKA